MNLRNLVIVLTLITLAIPSTVEAKHHRHHVSYTDNGNVLHGRPAGCPHRYCGCEASLYLFGKVIPELNLAANWKHAFPHTSPAPRMAAARSGHVMVLISQVSGTEWLVHDGNSGHGLTREHIRDISGYTIVDPSGNRMAHESIIYSAKGKHHQQYAQLAPVYDTWRYSH